MTRGGRQRAIANSARPRSAFYALCAVLFALCDVSEAQQQGKVPRIGYLAASPLSVQTVRVEAFRQGLRELGYVEGKNILIEWRSADGKVDRLGELAAELVRLKVGVILSAGPTATRPTKEATSTIPIVMAFDNDPVGSGLVVSLARPGGNITGLSTLAPEIGGKQLEILKDVIPKLTRVSVLGTSSHPGTPQSLKGMEPAAGALRVQLQYFDVPAAKEIEPALRAAANGHAEAVLLLTSSVFVSNRKQVLEFVAKNRLPAMYFRQEFIDEGGLMTYGVNIADLDRRAATYVDKILKGAKPAELPIEQPTKFEFVINLKTAKQIGLTIPPNVLARADKVIK
jgi:putative tryptophan/tyrosine transport system substrate-binding protein